MITSARTRQGSTPSWHHVRFDAPQLAEREHERMKMLFRWTWVAACRPCGMSLWIAPDDDGGADIYLSPRSTPLAGALIRRYRARPCGPPARSTLLIAGDGYGTYEPRVRAISTRSTATSRRFLPARYACRSVRSLARDKTGGPWPYISNQMAPFVRRFAKAWGFISPHPR